MCVCVAIIWLKSECYIWNFLLVVMFGGRFGGRHISMDEAMVVQVLCSQGRFTFKCGGNDDV